MTPVAQGRFCQSCTKQVVDFSMMTDQEVLNYFSKSTGNTCGRFNNDQLNRPLQPTKTEKRNAWWVAAIMPLLVFFTRATAQKKQTAKNIIRVNETVMGLMGDVVITKVDHPTDYWPVQSDDAVNSNLSTGEKCKAKATELTVARKKGSADFVVSGTLVNSRFDEPLPYATVTIKGTKVAVLADSAGNFSIKGKTVNSRAVLNISYVGFESTDVVIRIKDTTENRDIERIITGVVIDADNNAPLPFASVILKGGKTGTTTDTSGKFTLKLNEVIRKFSIVISYIGYKDKVINVPVTNLHSVTAIDTIKLTPAMISEGKIVVAGMTICTNNKPNKADTIPTFIRKVFHTDVFKVYPNPAQSGSLVTVEVKNEGSYSIQLYNSGGNIIMATPFDAIKSARQTSITIPAGLAPGMYYIMLFDNKKKKQYTDKLTVM